MDNLKGRITNQTGVWRRGIIRSDTEYSRDGRWLRDRGGVILEKGVRRESMKAVRSIPCVRWRWEREARERRKGSGSTVTALVSFSRAVTLTQASVAISRIPNVELGRYAVSSTNGEPARRRETERVKRFDLGESI